MISDFKSQFSFYASQYAHDKVVAGDVKRIKSILKKPARTVQEAQFLLDKIQHSLSRGKSSKAFSRAVRLLVRNELKRLHHIEKVQKQALPSTHKAAHTLKKKRTHEALSKSGLEDEAPPLKRSLRASDSSTKMELVAEKSFQEVPQKKRAAELLGKEKAEPKIERDLIANGISPAIAQQIAHGFATDWKDFVVEREIGGKKYFEQTSGPQGLKVYQNPHTGKMIADFGFKTLGQGGYKRAKWVVRLDEEGHVQHRVRLAKKKEGVDLGAEADVKKMFEEDIGKELEMREKLTLAGKGKEVPYLLGIIPIQYVSKKGKSIVTRYDTEKCEGDLQKLYKQPENPKALADALKYCGHALIAIKKMHERGFVHKDIKLDNIFFNEGRGLLADLGLCAQLPDEKGMGGDPYKPMGSPGYAAPEIILGADKNSPAMDMFSFGMVLLAFSNSKMHQELVDKQSSVAQGLSNNKEKFDKLQNEKRTLEALEREKGADPARGKRIKALEQYIKRNVEEREKMVGEYKQCLIDNQAKLLETKTPFNELIAALLDPVPGNRPTSAEAEVRYRSL